MNLELKGESAEKGMVLIRRQPVEWEFGRWCGIPTADPGYEFSLVILLIDANLELEFGPMILLTDDKRGTRVGPMILLTGTNLGYELA